MFSETGPQTFLQKLLTVPHAAALLFFLLILLTAENYGFYGDELYYIACSKRLDFGYVDHPPLIALLTLAGTWLFGETITGLRILSGLAGAVTVVLSARIARTLGGGTFARSLAALSILFAPAFAALSSFHSMNPVDIMLCTLFVLLLTRTVAAPSPQRWILLGVLAGAGLLNKYTFLVLGFALLIAFVLTRRWDVLRSRPVYAGGAVALLMFLPHLLWQIHHDWPTLEFMHNATEYKNLPLSPVNFFTQLTIGLNPVTLPLWLGGLLYLLFGKETRQVRFLGWAAVIFLLVYLLQNSKFYYVLPVIPLLLSSGAVAAERLAQSIRVRWPRWAYGAALIVSGAVLMPLAVPLLPVKPFVSYAKGLGLWDMVRLEKWEKDALPLHFVHRVGWEELVRTVGVIYNALPDPDRKQCAILTSWYGIAGAVDHFGPEHGLPEAICPRNNYWMWGPREYSGEVILAVGYDEDYLKNFFESVEHMAHFDNPYANDADIYLCRNPRVPLKQMWPRLKMFI